MEQPNEYPVADAEIRAGLALIKRHITADDTPQNRDLHEAVQRIVTACRATGLLGGVR